MRLILVCLSILSFQPIASLAAELILSPRGYGLIRFGQTLKLAETTLNERSKADDPEEPCTYVSFRKYPNVRFMVEDGVITRADVDASITNTSGIKVGMLITRAKRIQPGLIVEPHQYDPDGHYLTLSDRRKQFSLVFEANKFTVTGIRGGIQPSVSYVEGCL